MGLMILSECQEKQEVRLYAPFNRHWESVRIKSTDSIPVVHPINLLYKATTPDEIEAQLQMLMP
jgi:hypothetical protein